MRISQPSPWRQKKREGWATLVGRSEGCRCSGMEGLPRTGGPPISRGAPARCQVESGIRTGRVTPLNPEVFLAFRKLWNPFYFLFTFFGKATSNILFCNLRFLSHMQITTYTPHVVIKMVAFCGQLFTKPLFVVDLLVTIVSICHIFWCL